MPLPLVPRVAALAAFLAACLAQATQPPGRNAWDELRPESEAHAVMKRRCQAEAGEQFLATRENVKGLFLDSEERALSYVDGSSDSYGISYVHPPSSYLRSGLAFIEYNSDLAAVRRFEAPPKADPGPFMRFDTKTHLAKPVASRTAQVRISYKRTTSDAEEKIGVFGRLIEVTDEADATVLARRRDFVWLNPDKREAHGGFMCPTLKGAEYFPITFLSKVINVNSYPCWKTYENGKRAMPDKYDIRARDALVANLQACEANYFK